MSEIERRALLSAAGLGAVAAMSKAGPLNPPAGMVAPTGRTLDEIYNRIPALPTAGTYDGRIPISASYVITAPGSYVLTGNIDSNVAGNGGTLTIAASNVHLDLNGFSITNSAGGFCINIPGTSPGNRSTNITVRNGQLYGGYYGISDVADPAEGSDGLLLEDLRIYNPRYMGLRLVHAENGVIRRCTITNVGTRTTGSDLNATVAGIYYGGRTGRIEECCVHNLAYNGTGGGSLVRGIYINNLDAAAVLISRCHVANPAMVSGIGINVLASLPVIRDCTARNYTATYSGGTGGGGNVG